MSDEKRGLPRYPARLLGQYELLLGRVEDRHQPTEALDVGLRGCRLTTGQRTEIAGARVFVLLSIGEERVRMPGTIVWVRQPRGDAPGTMGVDLEPPIPAAYGELVAELAVRAPSREPRRTTPRPVTPPLPAEAATRQPAPTAAERLRAGLPAGLDSAPARHPDRPPLVGRAVMSSLGLLPDVAPVPRAPAAASEPRAPVPSLQDLDAVLLAFLAESSASQLSPGSQPALPTGSVLEPDTDTLLREFLATTPLPPVSPRPVQPAGSPSRAIDRLLRRFIREVRRCSIPVRPGRIDELLRDFLAEPAPEGPREPAAAGCFTDEDIDGLVGQLSSQEIDLLDQLRAAVAWSARVVDASATRAAVLLVHDDGAVLDAHTRELGSLLEVVRVSSLEQALAVLDRRDIELRAIVTDAVIQGDASAGIVLLQQARRRLPGCARVLVTTLRGELAEGYVEQGVAGRALPASYGPGELLAALRALLPVA